MPQLTDRQTDMSSKRSIGKPSSTQYASDTCAQHICS